MERIHHCVHRLHLKFVALAHRPIDDIRQPRFMQRIQNFLRYFRLDRADQTIRALQPKKCFGFQIIIEREEACGVARVKIIRPGDEHRMHRPFGRPCRVLDQEFMAVAGKRVFAIDAVVPQLIDVRIGFVGQPLAIAVDVQAAKAGGLNAVTAKFPHIVQRLVGGFKLRGAFIERIMHGDLPNRCGIHRRCILDLHISKRHCRPDLRRHPPRIPRVQRHGVFLHPLFQFHLHPLIPDRSAGFTIHNRRLR